MPNTSTIRETEVTIRSTDDPAQTLTVFVKQSAHGSYLSIAELRSLASNLTVGTPEYTITEDKKICAIVNTAAIGANLPGGVFGIQDAKEPGSGILVRTEELSWNDFGEELEIPVKGAVLTRDGNGVLGIATRGRCCDSADRNLECTTQPSCHLPCRLCCQDLRIDVCRHRRPCKR